ncbi:Ada metal-binding domain-containing protein [Spirosoma soli]|uniref:Ada metal-binding domain-containing protein n=1 Tax=Spirosoma soli TaxID=1770529 RepID=A0ABW5MF91_9BACT
MIRHTALEKTELHRLFRTKQLTLGGNRTLRIYGRLDCRAGKRMKAENRVFFADESEALMNGYRPCAVCLPARYREWRRSQ